MNADGPDDTSVSADVSGLVVRNGPNVVAEVPRAVALAVLAAEASDRLGWHWQLVPPDARYPEGTWLARTCLGPTLAASWVGYQNSRTLQLRSAMAYTTVDEALAALHGRALLEAALIDAGGTAWKSR